VPLAAQRAAPRLGEHTEEVLASAGIVVNKDAG